MSSESTGTIDAAPTAPAPFDRRAEPVAILRTAAGMRTDVDVRGHHVIVDEPVAIGGTDQGPSPRELVAVALGSCTSITLRMYADRKGWPLDDLVIRVWHKRVDEKVPDSPDERPQRVDVFETEIELGGDLSAEQRSRLLDIAGRCPVKKVLEGQARISTRLTA